MVRLATQLPANHRAVFARHRWNSHACATVHCSISELKYADVLLFGKFLCIVVRIRVGNMVRVGVGVRIRTVARIRISNINITCRRVAKAVLSDMVAFLEFNTYPNNNASKY